MVFVVGALLFGRRRWGLTDVRHPAAPTHDEGSKAMALCCGRLLCEERGVCHRAGSLGPNSFVHTSRWRLVSQWPQQVRAHDFDFRVVLA